MSQSSMSPSPSLFSSSPIESGTFSCPVCSEKEKNENFMFAHFVWKHPLEYVYLKKSNVSRSLMVMSVRQDFVRCLLKKFRKSTTKRRRPSESSDSVKSLTVTKSADEFQCSSPKKQALNNDDDPVVTSQTVETKGSQATVSTPPSLVLRLQKCHWCIYMSPDPLELANHDLCVHSDVPRYQCAYCALSFMQPPQLLFHVTHKHLGSSLLCAGCNATFEGPNDYCNHVFNECLKVLYTYYYVKAKK